MQFNVHFPSVNQFNLYTDNSVTIQDCEYSEDILVFNTIVKKMNPIYHIGELDITYLSEICLFRPDIMIIGTGKTIVYPEHKLIRHVQINGIGIEIMTIKSLCRTFNFLASENRKILALLLFNIKTS